MYVRKELKVKPGVYVPVPESAFPDDPQRRLVKVLVEDSSQGRFQFDETYPYIDESFSYRWRAAVHGIVRRCLHFYDRFSQGLKIRGKENLKGCGKAFEKGAMIVCNHVFHHDASIAYSAICSNKEIRVPMFAKHFNNPKDYFFIRYIGGIPVAETRAGLVKFNEAMDYYHSKGDWFLIFPEAVRWEYHTSIRPFRKGAFNLAYKYDIPIVPCVITYRKRTGFYRLFGPAEKPLLTLNICKPVFPDKEVRRHEEVDRLRNVTHAAMVEAAGIIQNPWPAKPDFEN